MINYGYKREELTEEQKVKFDEMLANNEASVQDFKLLRKNFTGIKDSIKKIEKRRLVMVEERPEHHNSDWIGWEIKSIEKKYEGIEKAIKKYWIAQRRYSKQKGDSANY